MLKKFTQGSQSVDDINLAVVSSLNQCSQSMERLSVTVLSKYNLTISQYNVLEILHREGPLRIRDIIERVLSTGGNMTVVIRNLEKNNLINRNSDDKDRRAIFISLSKEGSALIRKVIPHYQKFISQSLSKVSKKDKETCLKLSQTIRESIYSGINSQD